MTYEDGTTIKEVPQIKKEFVSYRENLEIFTEGVRIKLTPHKDDMMKGVNEFLQSYNIDISKLKKADIDKIILYLSFFVDVCEE
jgi:uncharacterized radical SAM superfamily Fe-S cluster-containing enzyme